MSFSPLQGLVIDQPLARLPCGLAECLASKSEWSGRITGSRGCKSARNYIYYESRGVEKLSKTALHYIKLKQVNPAWGGGEGRGGGSG